MISRNSTLYQIITDRFDNDSGNLWEEVNNPSYNERFEDFLGGTFNGITRRTRYLEELGVTHILISPIQASRHYHGYHLDDNFKINSRFGSEEDLKKMIDDLHTKGIKVLLDYPATHVSRQNPIFIEKSRSDSEKERDWFLFLDRMRGNVDYRSYFGELVFKLTSAESEKLGSINRGKYLGYFGLEECPLLNLENPDVKQWHKEALFKWFRKFGFDGIRLDSGFIQPKPFIRELTDYLKSSFKGVDVLAEYWDFEIPPRSGDCYGFCDGEFDIKATLWFNRMAENPDFFRDMSGHYYRSKDHIGDYTYVASLDNHDLPRFVTKNSRKLQRIAAVLQFTLPSIPLVYYGDEIAMGQYNNCQDRVTQSRDLMRWDLHDQEMFYLYRNLISFRKGNHFDDYSISDIQINDNGSLFTYRVNTGGKSFYVLLNREDRQKPVGLNELFTEPKFDNLDIASGMVANINGDNKLILEPESACLFGEGKE